VPPGNVSFWPKADIAKRRFDDFQPASLTRYNASLGRPFGGWQCGDVISLKELLDQPSDGRWRHVRSQQRRP
jgi:hypothetical protein